MRVGSIAASAKRVTAMIDDLAEIARMRGQDRLGGAAGDGPGRGATFTLALPTA